MVRRGEAGDGPFSLVITPESAGWGYSGLRVLELPAGGSATFDTGADEMLVLPLSGGCVVDCDGERFDAHRPGAACSPGSPTSPTCRATPRSRVRRGRRPVRAARRPRRPAAAARYGPAEDVPVELRGAGQASRQVNNFCTPDAFEADRLIAVEVLTPGGNWSSYPPHKHDEAARRRDRARGDLLLRGRRDRPARAWPTSASTGTRTGRSTSAPRCAPATSVLIPHGWHGPSMAAPGYDLYYLNVMAGPGAERGLADLRRPGPRLGPRHLGGPGDRPAAAADLAPRRSTMTVRLTVAQALVRFLANQYERARRRRAAR